MRVTDAKPEQWTAGDLLVVGSPTRGFQPTPAITELLKGLSADRLKGVKVAAFDTRIAMSDIKPAVLRAFLSLFNYAAPVIAKRLTAKGGSLLLAPEGFCVAGTEGPLKDGELERAPEWASRLLSGV